MPILESEKELENYLLEVLGTDCCPFDLQNSETRYLQELGYEHGITVNQFNITGYGVIDLINFRIESGDFDDKKATLIITILELKKNDLCINSFMQICRYRTAIERLIDLYPGKASVDIKIEGVLVGHKVSSGDVCFVFDNCDWISVYTYELSFKGGISFEHKYGYYCTNEKLENCDFPEGLEVLISEGMESHKELVRGAKLYFRESLITDMCIDSNCEEGCGI